jgi:hypothetical protein
MKHLLRFLVFEGFTNSSFKRGQTFIICFYPPLLYYDVSMDEVVELVVVIPMSQNHQKRSLDAKVITVFVLQLLQDQISAKDFWMRLPVRGHIFHPWGQIIHPGTL